MDINALIAQYPSMTDIHVTEGAAVMIRTQGSLKKLRETADASLFEDLAARFLDEEKQKDWEIRGSCDAGASLESCRLRIHMYHSLGKKAAAIRILPTLSSISQDPDKDWIERWRLWSMAWCW